MNNGKRYITPVTINVPSEVVDFLNECDDNNFNVHKIIDAIRGNLTELENNGMDTILAYESVTHS